MKCEWVRENIVLQVYGELADDARHELEQHVARCADCAAELKAEQDFHALRRIRRRICWHHRACGCRKGWKPRSRVRG
jgi:anti-sigma factor RsiW